MYNIFYIGPATFGFQVQRAPHCASEDYVKWDLNSFCIQRYSIATMLLCMHDAMTCNIVAIL